MSYFEEYYNLLSALEKHEKVKINIHFIISDPLKSFCTKTNQEANKRSIGFIDLAANKIIYPHVSVFMGFVDSYTMLENTFPIIDEYSQTVQPFAYEPTRIYFAGVAPSAPQYLFTSSTQDSFIQQQKSELNNILINHVYPLDWNMKDEAPHATIGCYKKVTPDLTKFIDTITTIPACNISQIGVSLCGKRGVCLGTLKIFDLGKH